MSAIDRGKLLEWVREQIEYYKQFHVIGRYGFAEGLASAFQALIEKIDSGAFDVRETELENKLNQAVEALKTIMYLPSSHPYVRAIADNALQSIKGGESNE